MSKFAADLVGQRQRLVHDRFSLILAVLFGTLNPPPSLGSWAMD
jgi:hypothetical protein